MKNFRFLFSLSEWKLFVTLLGGRLRLLECYILTSHDAYRFNNNMKLRGIYFFINKENVLLWTDMSSYEFLLIEKWFVKKDSWLWVMAVRKRETWRFHLEDFYFSEWENKMHNFLYELSWCVIMDGCFFYEKKRFLQRISLTRYPRNFQK